MPNKYWYNDRSACWCSHLTKDQAKGASKPPAGGGTVPSRSEFIAGSHIGYWLEPLTPRYRTSEIDRELTGSNLT